LLSASVLCRWLSDAVLSDSWIALAVMYFSVYDGFLSKDIARHWSWVFTDTLDLIYLKLAFNMQTQFMYSIFIWNIYIS